MTHLLAIQGRGGEPQVLRNERTAEKAEDYRALGGETKASVCCSLKKLIIMVATSRSTSCTTTCRIHKTLRVAPAMEAGVAHHVWTIEELEGYSFHEPWCMSIWLWKGDFRVIPKPFRLLPIHIENRR
jgi:hypothetical protein